MTANEREDIASYAAAVRAAVADLGADESAQLLDDLEAHLQEVASESGAPLTDRLGPPEAYAAELRAAYGATPTARAQPAAPPRRRRWRRTFTVLVPLLLVAIVASAVAWQLGQSGSTDTSERWSYAHLQSEAAAGNVTRVVIEGRSGIATDRGGVQHAVSLPDSTASLASELAGDGVNVVYEQQPAGLLLHLLWIPTLLFVTLSIAIVLLVVGVLWRLYRRLGRFTRIM